MNLRVLKGRRPLIGLVAGLLALGLAELVLFFTASRWQPVPDFLGESRVDKPPAASKQASDQMETARLPALAFFQDVTAESGVEFVCRNGEEADHLTLLQSLGGGVALFDFDGDGLLDIFLVGGGYFGGQDNKEILGVPGKLYKNLGNWKFRNVTAETGLDQLRFYAHGCAVADYDGDGWPDLLVTGYGSMALLHNESDGRGGRRFADVTGRAHLQDGHWNTSAAWADLDGDGHPDLYVCRYVDWSWTYSPPSP